MLTLTKSLSVVIDYDTYQDLISDAIRDFLRIYVNGGTDGKINILIEILVISLDIEQHEADKYRIVE